MIASHIRIRCPRCSARIKAPSQLIGRWRDCPCCGRRLVVRRSLPRDSDPMLVLVEHGERCSLGLAYRRGA